MQNAVAINDHTGLELLFSGSLRAQAYLKHGWLDINSSLEPSTERSFLHLAARADNMELVVWGLKYGADPNCTDIKGKKPIELAKSEKVKDLLRHAKSNAAIVSESLSQATSAESPQAALLEAPTIKGVLSKYTNLKDGYQNRYFVLENGVFSYYHSMQDYPLQCRGSIATKALTAHFSGSDQTRFDVSVEGYVKFYLRARSVAEAKKWVWALMESKRWMIDHANDGLENSIGLSGDKTPSEFGSSVLENSELSKKMEETEIAQALETEEERNDLFEYLDKHACNGFDNPELKRLLVLLKTELDAQKSTVATVSNIMGDIATANLNIPMISNLNELPHLLADSSLQIEALVFGIVKFMNRRESILEQRLLTTQANVERLELIMNQLEVEAVKDYQEPIPIAKIASIPALEKDEYDTASDSDEFFDALDGGMTVGSVPSITKPDIFYQIPQEVQDLQPTDGFISSTQLEKLLAAYYKIWPSRDKLPLDPSLPMPKLAVWSFLKSAIGKDLSKITLPVLFNEPLSMLQRFAEDVEYIELLTVAARIGCGDVQDNLADPIVSKYCTSLNLSQQTLQTRGEDSSLLRLAYVAAFAISNYSSTVDRTSKPFNPLLVFLD